MNSIVGILCSVAFFLMYYEKYVTSACRNEIFHDCQEYFDFRHKTSGVYHVTPLGTYTGYDVVCDMTTAGGGWLVFQRRVNGSVDFYRDWDDYEFGFGDPTHEFWLGLLPLKIVLSQGFYELRIELPDWNNTQFYASYKRFDIGRHSENYKLTVDGFSGTASKGDSLSSHDGDMFSTRDKDNDENTGDACAVAYQSAWWFNDCHQSSLNGRYWEGETIHHTGIVWYDHGHLRGYNYSWKATEMKIRRI